MITDDTGMITDDTGMITDDTGMITDDTGMITDDTGMIDENIGVITETNDVEYAENGRRKRSRERGKDIKPRNFPLHTMKNLPQFRNKSHEEVRQYILEKKGVDIGSNVNALYVALIVAISLVAITSPLWIKKLVDWHNKRKLESSQ